MLTEPLPTTLDVRKAAAREVGVSGVLKPQDLTRFRPLLAGDEGQISVEMAFDRDEENRYRVRVVIEADVTVICQRCLETMSTHVSSDSSLAVVWTDEEASELPRRLDPLVEPEQTSNLWALAEDELILNMPPFSYHETAECVEKMSAFSDPAPEGESGESKPNPFEVLGQLKPGEN